MPVVYYVNGNSLSDILAECIAIKVPNDKINVYELKK